MLFFNKPILSKARVKALNKFRKNAVKALQELAKKAPDENTRLLYEHMAYAVEHTPIYFYPSKSLKEKVFVSKGRIVSSQVMGENVNVIHIIQKGSKKFFLRTNFINLPADHIFHEDKLTVSGIFTLAHEYAHFPKPLLREFAGNHRISVETAEELLADVLSAKLAVKMGYPKEKVLEHFHGRELVYGQIPFEKFILNAIK